MQNEDTCINLQSSIPASVILTISSAVNNGNDKYFVLASSIRDCTTCNINGIIHVASGKIQIDKNCWFFVMLVFYCFLFCVYLYYYIYILLFRFADKTYKQEKNKRDRDIYKNLSSIIWSRSTGNTKLGWLWIEWETNRRNTYMAMHNTSMS